MNIFYLDPDPQKCAQYHCDKHVIKLILETAQLLEAVHIIAGSVTPYSTGKKRMEQSSMCRMGRKKHRELSVAMQPRPRIVQRI